MSRTLRDRVRAKFRDLQSIRASSALVKILVQADGGVNATGASDWLLDAQIERRRQYRVETAKASSRLPYMKTLANFDFSKQPSINRSQVMSLLELECVRRREDAVFYAQAGVDKPAHLGGGLAAATASPPIHERYKQ